MNESNEWIYPHLQVAQDRMTALAEKISKKATALQKRALQQARP
ncbi:MAG: hypothetical protein WDN00_07525 [Limisphaerales bacterium]